MIRVQAWYEFVSQSFMALWHHYIYLTPIRISPHSSLNVTYCLIITAWQWLMSFMPCIMQIKPNKSPLRNRLKALLLWEIGHLSSPSRSCLGRLILIHNSWESFAGRSSPTGCGDSKGLGCLQKWMWVGWSAWWSEPDVTEFGYGERGKQKGWLRPRVRATFSLHSGDIGTRRGNMLATGC